MQHASRRPAVLVLLALVASLLGVITPTAAYAAESIPTLKWPPVVVGSNSGDVEALVASPAGTATLACTYDGPGIRTYDADGQLVQSIDRSVMVDGVENCIGDPKVAKDGDVYGIPQGNKSGGGYGFGPNLLAYAGNTLKWKYPVSCSSSGSSVAVGADGNIYATNRLSNGQVRLIGLKPDLETGQTQPTKILDVQVPSDCSMSLYPYKDGIMLHGSSTSGSHFYSYTGREVSTVDDSLGDEQKINERGRLFTWSVVTGSYFDSISVSVYDPNQKKVMWTTSASTPSADTNGATLYPMKDGGVAVLVKEQKMNLGVPVSPTQWVRTLTIINAAGIKVRSSQFPTSYSNGAGLTGTYGDAWNILPDNEGKVVVIRKLDLNTGVGYPTKVPAIDIGVYNAVSDTWPYRQIMRGDLVKSGGPNGYLWNNVGTDIADDTVFFPAWCQYNCANTSVRLYAVQVSGLGKSYPRAEVTNTSPRPSAAYVALGDSYSSGEGVTPFEVGTDTPTVNTCHRSENAYPELIAGTGDIPSLGSEGFRACSGAVSDNIWNNPEWNEGIQLDWWPDTTTQVVTMTIGGNDIAFVDFAKACVIGTCQVGSSAYNTSLDKINNELPGALTATYQKILAEFPNAEIYVMDYPQVIADKQSSDPFDSRWLYMYNSTGDTGAAHYPWEDAWGARDIVSKLDAKISTAISGMNNARLHYVPANASGSPFIGHGICDSGTSYFQNLDQVVHNEAYVFHPNATGQQKYADLMSAEINAS